MRTFCLGLAAALASATPAAARESVQPPPPIAYADMADLALTAPIAAHIRTRSAIALKREQAGTVRPGFARVLVEADIVMLIRGADGIPARVRYLVDVPLDAKGRTPKIRKGSEYILLASPVPGRPEELRLTAPDAQLAWSAERSEQLRAILREATAASPPPRITGIGKAFHVPGSLPGESETQIFLLAADGRPVSLNILRRPGESPSWSVALSEIVDDAAAAPRRDTLLWYRLACSLPRTLPAQSLADSEGRVDRIRADYRLVLEELGPCSRNRPQRS